LEDYQCQDQKVRCSLLVKGKNQAKT